MTGGRSGMQESKQASFTCIRCGRTSYNPNDAAAGYCGACHDWTGPMMGWNPAGERVELLPWQARAVRIMLGMDHPAPGEDWWERGRGGGKSTVIETARRLDPALGSMQESKQGG